MNSVYAKLWALVQKATPVTVVPLGPSGFANGNPVPTNGGISHPTNGSPPAAPTGPTTSPTGPTTSPTGPIAVVSGPYIEQRAVLDLIKLEALGHYPDGSIDIFSQERRQVNRIPKIARLAYPELVLFCGEVILNTVHAGTEIVSGRKTMEEVRNAIAFFGGLVSLVDANPVGQGVWLADDQITIISGGQAAVFDPVANTLTQTFIPRVGRQILDFATTEEWCDFTELKNYLDLSLQPSECQAWLQEAIGLFSRWYWKHPIDATVATCLATATWIQTLLHWRPEITVAGSSNSGKTTFFDSLLTRLYGHMACQSDQPTEAALRQAIRNTSVAIIVDEFEKSEHRQRILNLFRSSSRGAIVRRGTADQHGKRFIIRHIPWFSAIESGLQDEADRNRFIILDMLRPPVTAQGKISLPAADRIQDLGLRLLAIALRHARTINDLFLFLKTQHFPGVNGRVVESYAIPAAVLAAVRQTDQPGALAILSSFLQGKEFARQGLADEQALIRAIMESHFDQGTRRRSIGEALSNESTFSECRKAIERHGVALICNQQGPRKWGLSSSHFLAFNITSIQRHLLKGTRWEDLDVGQILERLPGAHWKSCSIAARRVTCLCLPAKDHLTAPDTQGGDGHEASEEDKLFQQLSQGLKEPAPEEIRSPEEVPPSPQPPPPEASSYPQGDAWEPDNPEERL
jgi:hypothetical protein